MSKKIKKLYAAILVAVLILGTVPGRAAAEHEHEWQYTGSSDESCHVLYCTTCSEYLWVAHTFGSDMICSLCGFEHSEHSWNYTGYRDASQHELCCYGCGTRKMSEHSFDGTICTVCSYDLHVHTWVHTGVVYGYDHEMYCTECGGITTELHTFGSNGYCTVCGAPPAHEHEWKYNGKFDYDYHYYSCQGCTETILENHKWAWDGIYRNERFHKQVCTVCKRTMETTHWFDQIGRCVTCGYERVYHSWKYNNYFDENIHDMICDDCGSIRSELHCADRTGNCTVCGLHIHDPEPVKSESTEPTPTEPKTPEPMTTEIISTISETVESVVTEPALSESKSAESASAKSALTEPAPTESTPEPTPKSNTDGSKNTVFWVAVTLVSVLGLGTAILMWKKKNT